MWGGAPCRSKCYRRVVRLYRCIIPFLAAGIHPWVIRPGCDVISTSSTPSEKSTIESVSSFDYYARERFRNRSIVLSRILSFVATDNFRPFFFPPVNSNEDIIPTIFWQYSIWSWMERRRELATRDHSVIREIVKIVSRSSSGASSLDFRFLLLYRPRSMRLAVETRFSSALSRVNCETIAGKHCIRTRWNIDRFRSIF